jgi:predicted DNA-binding protein with PD1-like motif
VQSKLLIESHSFQSWAIIFEGGEEVITELLSFAEQNSIVAASFTAIGAFASAVLGVSDWQTHQYFRIPVDEPLEVVTVMGDISFECGSRHVHAQAALAKSCGVTVGGHLLEGRAQPMLQVILSSPPRHIERRYEENAGLTVARV